MVVDDGDFVEELDDPSVGVVVDDGDFVEEVDGVSAGLVGGIIEEADGVGVVVGELTPEVG